MASNSTVLCIHREPTQLNSLKESGYELLTATNGHDGLRLFMSQPVDAIVLEYYLGLLDGAVIAAEIKQVQPQIPIVMLADPLELPEGALNCVDIVVAKSDGPHFLWAAVDLVLKNEPVRHPDADEKIRTREGPWLEEAHSNPKVRRLEALALVPQGETGPFSAELWESILDGTIQF